MRSLHVLLLIFATALLPQKYEKDISTREKRIAEYKKEKTFPEDWKLFYRGKEADYIVFYDLDGNEVYFQYRRDELDREAEAKIIGLFQGQAYRVKGKYKGILLYRDEKDKINYRPPVFQQGSSILEENKFSISNIPIFILISFESTSLDEVIK